MSHGQKTTPPEERALPSSLGPEGDQAKIMLAAFGTIANAIMITDPSGTIRWVNRAFSELTGYAAAAVVGQTPRLLKSGRQSPALYRDLWATILSGRVWRGASINRRCDGRLYYCEQTITPLCGPDGRIAQFVSVMNDITERKRMEEQNLHMQRQQIIGTLASGVAHDLNNILAPIMMSVGILKERLGSAHEHDQGLLALIESCAQRGGDITRQLLVFSHAAEEDDARPIQPRRMVEETVRLMEATFPRNIEIVNLTPDDLGGVTIHVTQLHQVLMNLCVNARDAMPAGGRLTLNARNVTLDEKQTWPHVHAKPGVYVMLSVADTGCGIPPEVIGRIFDPFFTTKDVGKGTGLGLSTVQGIVTHCGGFLTVDSELGRGSTFAVHLPATPLEAEAEASAEPSGVLPPACTDGHGELILVVDDEPTVRAATSLLLERSAYRVLTAADGDEALDLFVKRRGEVRLVLTDLLMPGMAGVALVRALRDTAAGVRVIAMNGNLGAAQRTELAALGVTEFLQKPCARSTLLQAVGRQLSVPK